MPISLIFPDMPSRKVAGDLKCPVHTQICHDLTMTCASDYSNRVAGLGTHRGIISSFGIRI